MDKLRRLTQPVCHLVIFGMLGMHLSAAQAGMIGTEAVVNAAQVGQNRERLHDVLNRDDVKAQLLARGVDPAQVRARVDGLTDAEVQTLSARMDRLSRPAVRISSDCWCSCSWCCCSPIFSASPTSSRSSNTRSVKRRLFDVEGGLRHFRPLQGTAPAGVTMDLC